MQTRGCSMATSRPPPRCPQQQLRAPSRAPALRVCASASGGFGKAPAKKKAPKTDNNLTRELRSIAEDTASAKRSSSSSSSGGGPAGFPEDWVDLRTTVNDFTIGKPNKPVILASGKAVVLYKHDNRVFCSDANSTAFQYPLIDAKVTSEGGRTLVEVPLDGTVYNLGTGEVVTWCPKDSPVRNLLGTLKQSVAPLPLPVYPVHINKDGGIWIKLLE